MAEDQARVHTPVVTVWVIRAFFVLISAGVGWIISESIRKDGERVIDPFYGIIGATLLYVAVVLLELLLGSLSNISALVFGLVVGVILGHFGYLLAILHLSEEQRKLYGEPIKLILICMFSYLAVVLIFKTRERFNFIIPYVEFHRQTRGAAALVLDTSSIIDGRIADVLATGVIDVPVVVPRFVIDELQSVADSSDRLRRARGRRGLDVLQRVQSIPNVETRIDDTPMPGAEAVDARLVRLAGGLGARLATTDFNLQKVAALHNVGVLNLNDLAVALRPTILPGEDVDVELIREGEEPGQGVGFLNDGTMVVAEDGKAHVGRRVGLNVSRVLQTSSGRMIFGRVRTSADST